MKRRTRRLLTTFPLVVATVAIVLAVLAFLPSINAASSPSSPLINSGNAACNGTLAPNGYSGDYFMCPTVSPYDVLTLKPVLTSTSPSGNSLYVGYCGPVSGGSCTAHYKLTSPGNAVTTFSASGDTPVYSFYGNPNSVQVAYTATDYYTWN